MRTLPRALALSIVTVLALAGCLKVDMDLTLNSDDTVSGTVIMAIEEGTGEEFGLSDEDVLGELTGGTDEEFPGGEVTEYNEDGFVGQQITFSDRPLEEFSGVGGDIEIYRDGDDYVVEGSASATEGADADQIPGNAEATMSVTFPGSIEDTNGVVDGTTVTWNLFDTQDGVYARGAAEPDSGFALWIIVALGLAVGIAVGVGMWLLARNKKSTPDAAAGYPVAQDSEHVAAPVAVNPDQPVAPAPATAPVAPTAEDSAAPAGEAPASAYPDIPEGEEASAPSPERGNGDVEGGHEQEPPAR